MKLHLPRLLAAAVLAACVSAPVFADDRWERVNPGETWWKIHGENAFVDLLRWYQKQMPDSLYKYSLTSDSVNTGWTPFAENYYDERPLFWGGELYFTTYEGCDKAALSFTNSNLPLIGGGKGSSGDIRFIYQVSNVTFDNLRQLEISNITVQQYGLPENIWDKIIDFPRGVVSLTESSTLTIKDVSDDNLSTNDVIFSKNTGDVYGTVFAGRVTMTGNGSILFDENKVTGTSQYFGSAIHAACGGVEISRNQAVTFSNNSGAGAIVSVCKQNEDGSVQGGNVDMVGNTGISFTTNETYGEGGAIYAAGDVTIKGNDSVLFDTNKALSHGGALYTPGAVLLEGNGDITFNNNKSTGSFSLGGAIYATSVSICENTGKTSFTGNSAGYSGAIYIGSNGSLDISGNAGDISFIGNTSEFFGGAISLSEGSTLKMADNAGDVTFSNNLARSSGGAIYASGTSAFDIRNNETVIFEKNAYESQGYYVLRSLEFNSSSDNVLASLSAAAGKSIEFRDSISGYVNLSLNEAYNGIEQSGDIIFTGAYTEKHLNEVLEAAGANRTAVESEIMASRKTDIYGWVTLGGGKLRIEEGANFKARQGIELKADSGSTLLVKNATVGAQDGYGITIQRGNYMITEGTSVLECNVSINEASLRIDQSYVDIKGSLTLSRSESASGQPYVRFALTNGHQEKAAISLSGALNIEGKTAIGVYLDKYATDGRYILIDTGDASVVSGWNADNISIWGYGTTGDISYSDLVWENGTLYYNYSLLEWSNVTGDHVFGTLSSNWQEGRNYQDGMNVKFTGAGIDAESGVGMVKVSGALKTGTVWVDNATGEYVFTEAEGGGSLAGDADLVKRGNGTLTVEMANSLTGETRLEEGTLNLHYGKALGSSTFKMAEGAKLFVDKDSHVVLEGKGHNIAGEVNVTAGSTLEMKDNDGGYVSSTSKVEGMLAFTGSNAAAGKLEGNAGTVQVVDSQVSFEKVDDFHGRISVSGGGVADISSSKTAATINLHGATLKAAYLTLNAGGSINMASGTTPDAQAKVNAQSVYVQSGATLSASKMEPALALALDDVQRSGSMVNSAVSSVIESERLWLNAGATLELDKAHIDLVGTALTFAVTSDDKIKLALTLDGVLMEGGSVVLFTGVKELNLKYNADEMFGLTQGVFRADDYFTGDMIGSTTLMHYQNGTLTMTGLVNTTVPEPTTATLSLLALAALAARRRRK